MPGYFRGVPLGRKNWLIPISGNDSNTDNDNHCSFSQRYGKLWLRHWSQNKIKKPKSRKESHSTFLSAFANEFSVTDRRSITEPVAYSGQRLALGRDHRDEVIPRFDERSRAIVLELGRQRGDIDSGSGE